uniref:Uncharacterized protein n=1 Tax=Strigamia maritima TaxID=126957 RepID=T1JK22_STRMM
MTCERCSKPRGNVCIISMIYCYRILLETAGCRSFADLHDLSYLLQPLMINLRKIQWIKKLLGKGSNQWEFLAMFWKRSLVAVVRKRDPLTLLTECHEQAVAP